MDPQHRVIISQINRRMTAQLVGKLDKRTSPLYAVGSVSPDDRHIGVRLRVPPPSVFPKEVATGPIAIYMHEEGDEEGGVTALLTGVDSARAEGKAPISEAILWLEHPSMSRLAVERLDAWIATILDCSP